MSEEIGNRIVIVANPQGLHARPARLFVELANCFDADIEVVKDGEPADGKSILSILTLAAGKDSRLTIRATGCDAEEALAALAELVELGFAEGGSADSSEPSDQDGLEDSQSAEAESSQPQ